MTILVFHTPGVLDLRALTTFGMSAKPATQNPIGHFGTGLKYAVAVMVRLGAEPILHRHYACCSFHRKPVEFRGTEFDAIEIRHRRFEFAPNQADELPFTTQLGKNWEPWQAFRELEANTRDEGGETYLTEQVEGIADHTLICTDHPDMLAAYANRDEIFLPDAVMPNAAAGPSVRTAPGPSAHLYYRGLRVADLARPALFIWNLVACQELTEDRTLKYEYLARCAVAEHVAQSDDETLIDTVLRAPPTAWEHDLVFDYAKTPSEAFRRVMTARAGRVTESAQRYFAGYLPAPEPAPSIFLRYPRPWTMTEKCHHIYDALNNEVLTAGSDITHNDDERKDLMTRVLQLVNEAPE